MAPYVKRGIDHKAELISPKFSGITCISLEALMFQRGVKALHIKVKYENEESVVGILSGEQGDQWIQIQHSIFLPETTDYQVKSQKKNKEKFSGFFLEYLKLLKSFFFD
jgi:hypothetical protein